MIFKNLYSQFLSANKDVQHYASHSHHYWPDVSLEAHNQYWLDSCKYVDQKWDYFFDQKLPQAQKLIAKNIDLSDPNQIVFAPNTHELVYRLLSSLPLNKPLHILTTDSEFYSFNRQIDRFSERSQVHVDKIATEPFDTFEDRFTKVTQNKNYDFVFVSHVFFNSGYKIENPKRLFENTSKDCICVLDAYHSFMALPYSHKDLQDKVFYLAGSYKYAQGGEGCCFMTVPLHCKLRPEYTGWFSHFESLGSEQSSDIHYSNSALRFAGSTIDFTALYRLIAVLELLEYKNITVEKIDNHVKHLQKYFINDLKKISHPFINEKHLLIKDVKHCGHFLTFHLPDTITTARTVLELKEKAQIIVDSRHQRLRFGFGLYQEDHIDWKNV